MCVVRCCCLFVCGGGGVGFVVCVVAVIVIVCVAVGVVLCVAADVVRCGLWFVVCCCVCPQDVVRTFVGHRYFDSVDGKNALRRILTMYAFRNPEVCVVAVVLCCFV